MVEETEEEKEEEEEDSLEYATDTPLGGSYMTPPSTGGRSSPFAMSTGQRCVPLKHLVRKVYHPYKDPVGQCRCELGG